MAHNKKQPKKLIISPAQFFSRPSPCSFLLDSLSDEEDDADLVPIAVLTSPAATRPPFQSAAEKYKEKVKATYNFIQ